MHKTGSLATIAMLIIAGCMVSTACSGADKGSDDKSANDAVTETTVDISSLSYQERYDLWTAELMSYMEGESPVSSREEFSGTDDFGNSYSSYYKTADDGNYRSIEVVFEHDDGAETHLEFYDIDTDLMYIVDTDTVLNSDGTVTWELNKYAVVNGKDIYLLATDEGGNIVETLIEDEEYPAAYKTFDEVIGHYAG